jgi:hypothetical protein
MAGVSKKSAYPNLVSDADKCARFLSEFVEDYATGDKKYLEQLQRIANREQNTLNISIDDIKQVRRRGKQARNEREGVEEECAQSAKWGARLHRRVC